MKFYKLDPEVAGEWGPNTDFVRTPGMPVVVRKLHYQFDGWLGDELLESSSCYIVTERLAESIRSQKFSGGELKTAEISLSDQFREIYPGRQLPKFVWLDIAGKAGVDDFGMDSDGRLVVSERAFLVLKSTQISNCEVSDFS